VGACTLPVATMVWLGTVMTLGAIGVAIVAGGAAAGPLQKMIDTEAAAAATPAQETAAAWAGP
jgi:hypothetical protein